jgi:hypothetical protein
MKPLLPQRPSIPFELVAPLRDPPAPLEDLVAVVAKGGRLYELLHGIDAQLCANITRDDKRRKDKIARLLKAASWHAEPAASQNGQQDAQNGPPAAQAAPDHQQPAAYTVPRN